ncbi:addiction module protein [Pseudoduganella sp. LjRoot289]|uniref:addiction module protein n=1 Tax=Pseudoduganella sp. LjRoot289 TaxID=3342314 RepID=UPI003ECF848A
MSATAKTLIEQLAMLTAPEKIALAEELLASACIDDAAWEAAWAQEVQQRLASLAQGDSTASDATEVLKRLAAEFSRP